MANRVEQRKPVIIVQGGQWGSEAKGAVAAHLCISRDVDFAVRTGAINAGHTVVYNGKRFAMQQIPTGWVNPKTRLIIGAGAYIHPDTLWREIDQINVAMPDSDVRERLFVDFRCGIHDHDAEERSADANRHHRIGATGKGCSEAIVAKIRNRGDGYELFKQTSAGKWAMDHGLKIIDTVRMLNWEIDAGAKVLLEGTQGTLLDMHLGPYPYTTSRMTSAANWVSEAGLAPGLTYETILVVRTFPIRVAGNSGPMDGEIEWVDLARAMNAKLFEIDQPPVVQTQALDQFESNLQVAAAKAVVADRYRVPVIPHTTKFQVRMSEWTAHERSVYRVAASELHRDAINLCGTNTIIELKKLFEMTTVTKKLRRLAVLNTTDLQYAIQINRPTWIVLTFGDYLEPFLANWVPVPGQVETLDARAAIARLLEYTTALETALRVPVKMVSTGPLHQHLFRTSALVAPKVTA